MDPRREPGLGNPSRGALSPPPAGCPPRRLRRASSRRRPDKLPGGLPRPAVAESQRAVRKAICSSARAMASSPASIGRMPMDRASSRTRSLAACRRRRRAAAYNDPRLGVSGQGAAVGVIVCVECGIEVNDAVARCPGCGADPRTGFTDEERAGAAESRTVDPVEQARRARERGQRLLEIALRFDDGEVAAMRTGRRRRAAESATESRAAQLGAIEAEGWRLVSASYATGAMEYRRDPMAFLDGGPIDVTSLVGIYLFRAVDEVAGRRGRARRAHARRGRSRDAHDLRPALRALAGACSRRKCGTRSS